jgi:hypothetical protein
MSIDLESGLIVSYPYLRRRQAEVGQDNAEKDRPVCLAIVLHDPRQDLTHLVILAITSTPPQPEQRAMEIPALEVKRAGLSTLKRAWLMVGEYNYDVVERSYYFEPNEKPWGRFGPRFLEEIRRTIRPLLAQREGRVDRTN